MRVSQGHSGQNLGLVGGKGGGEKLPRPVREANNPGEVLNFLLFLSFCFTAPSLTSHFPVWSEDEGLLPQQEVPFSSLPLGWTTQLGDPHLHTTSALLLLTNHEGKGGDGKENDDRKEAFKGCI